MAIMSRRNVLANSLVIAAASAAAATAVAIPSVSAVAHDVPAGVSGVSPRMSGLIADFVRLSASLDAAETSGDLKAWDRAAESRKPALEALVFERPSSLLDLAAKMSALSEFMKSEDSEGFVFRRLAGDATALAGSAAK
jgi:hypothetical protein